MGVVVGNGYNSTEADGAQSPDGNAKLFVLNAKTGAVLTELDTGHGRDEDPATSDPALQRPNGLASVFPVDKDADFITDYVYAGHLFGSVWRFDLTSDSSTEWHVAEFGTGAPTPLFKAVDGSGKPQAITTQVQVGAHPHGVNRGVIVYFGTGKYLENGDETPDTSTTQTFYGIWDKDFPQSGSLQVDAELASLKKSGFIRGELQQQQIEAEATASGAVFRKVTNNPVDYTVKHGWYLDLKLAGGANEGEMVIADPVIRGKAVIFTTLVPNSQPCVAGGTGFLMVLDQATGGRTNETPFDLTNDRKFTDDDYVDFGGETVAASGIDITGNTPGFILADDRDHALIPLFDGQIAEEDLNLGDVIKGRKTWRQLR